MNDFLSKTERSALMSCIRSRGTQPENLVRRALWDEGFRYRLNVRKLPGAPDLVLRRYKTAVLVQGCFWHSHDCPKGRRRPSTNVDFWNRKLDGNVARDERNLVRLMEMGWTVFVIWECSLKTDTASLLGYLAERRTVANRSSQHHPNTSQSREVR